MNYKQHLRAMPFVPVTLCGRDVADVSLTTNENDKNCCWVCAKAARKAARKRGRS